MSETFEFKTLAFIVESNPIGWLVDARGMGHLIKMDLIPTESDKVRLRCTRQAPSLPRTIVVSIDSWATSVVPAIYVQHLPFWSIEIANLTFNKAKTDNIPMDSICRRGSSCNDLSPAHLARRYHEPCRNFAGISYDGDDMEYHAS